MNEGLVDGLIRLLNLQRAEAEELKAIIEKQRQVVEAAKKASKIISEFYLKVQQENRTLTIQADDCHIWFARNQLDEAIAVLEEK